MFITTMLIDLKNISPLCLSTLCHEKTSYLDILNLSLFISCSIRVTMVVFADLFEEFYIFAVIMDPFQTSL